MTDNVSFERTDYREALPQWGLARDFIDGQAAVKAKGVLYLPDPNMLGDDSNGAIYARYLQRACLFPVVGQTCKSMIGAAFGKWPELSAPANLEYVDTDIDGSGISIYQQSQSVTADVLRAGRAALFVDFPESSGALSVADMQTGAIRPNVIAYPPEAVINWRTEKVGAINRLALVVIRETAIQAGDFSLTEVDQWRELRLMDGVYVVRLWQRDTNRPDELILVGESMPTMANGLPWSEIPFCFIGSENNDPNIDNAPLMDIASLNAKHYQLAADWYNALFYAGQPQPTITGLSESWRDWLAENNVAMGSRAMLPLPVGGDFKYAIAPADQAIPAELTALENRMIALGARLMQPGGVAKTAEQARAEVAANHSVLSLVCENVSEAYEQALKYAQMYMGGAGEVEYSIEMDKEQLSVDAQLLTALLSANQLGKLPDSELYRLMRKLQLVSADKTDEELREESGDTVPRMGGMNG